jgi:hypothetical protein
MFQKPNMFFAVRNFHRIVLDLLTKLAGREGFVPSKQWRCHPVSYITKTADPTIHLHLIFLIHKQFIWLRIYQPVSEKTHGKRVNQCSNCR